MSLNEFKKEIDPLIDSFIQSKIDKLPEDKEFKFLINYFRYVKEFIRDGKRIRPYIAFLTYSRFGGKNKKTVIELLVFLEIFHYFCLIHDDIMDNSLKRHGVRTIHNKFGISQAILIGDYAFAWSWEIINKASLDQKQPKQLLNLFSEMIEEVFMGQAADTYSSKKKIVSDNLIMKKTLYKTAGYSFTKPMLIGLILAGEYKNENIIFCEKLGKNLGLAYQLQDDILDITSDFEGNKTSLSDISEGMHTIFSNYVIKNGTAEQKLAIQKVFGKRVKDVKKARQIFYDSGSITYGKKLIQEYLDEARRLTRQDTEFSNLVDLISARKS